MINTITFIRAATSKVMTPVQGSVRDGGGHDDRGGGRIPAARAGYAYNGSAEFVVVDTATPGSKQQTLADLIDLASGVGEGDVTVIGAGIWSYVKSWKALIDVRISGDSVQVAEVSWKGSANPEAAGGGD